MKIDLDILAVAVQLVREFGEGAERMARARLVESIAADNPRAADFWRQVSEQAAGLVDGGLDAASAASRLAAAGIGGGVGREGQAC